jgi:hypothetical protein
MAFRRQRVTKVQHCRAIVFPLNNDHNTMRRGAQRPLVVGHLTSDKAAKGSGERMNSVEHAGQSVNLSEKEQEARQIRRLQLMISMVMSVISQDPNLTVEEASELVAGAKRAALAMFPDKEFAYDILYKPRLQRLMNERFRLQ